MHKSPTSWSLPVVKPLALAMLLCCTAGMLQAQKTPAIPTCTDCVDSLLTTFWFPPPSIKEFVKDTVSNQFTYETTQESEVLIFVGNPDFIVVTVNGKVYYGGRYQAKEKLTDGRRFFVPVWVNDGLNQLVVKSHSLTDEPFFYQPILVKNLNPLNVDKAFSDNNTSARMLSLVLITALGVLFIYSLFHFIIYRNNEFFYYGCYVGYVLVYNLLSYDWFSETHFLFASFPFHYVALADISQQLIFFFYLNFVIHFLSLETVDNFSCKIIQILKYSLLAIGASLSCYIYFTRNIQFVAENLSILYIPPFLTGLYLFYRIWRKGKTYLRYYILIGGLLVAVTTLLELVISSLPESSYYNNYFAKSFGGFYGFSFSQMGILIELLLFLLAISMRTRDNEFQLIGLKNTTIQQLEENRKLEVQVKDLLQDKLTQSEEALEIEKLNGEKQKTESSLLKAQLKSLQLQMNPHYLFNSLNSINDFIISQNPMEASEYLALYARMMRNVLKNSDKMFNTLNEELSFCADYLELEQLRFGNKFSFRIERPQNPKQLQVKIPAMLLQPVLENAVWHGMMHLKSKGEIVLDASRLTATRTCIRITDNGNGLKIAEEKSAKEQSYGIRNIKEKVSLIEKMYGEKTLFTINNRTDNTGVEVIFEFPVFTETVKNEPKLNNHIT